MKTTAVLLCFMVIALSGMTCISKIEANTAKAALKAEQARQPFIELMKDPRNGDIFLRADKQYYYHFKNACQTIGT